MRVKLKMIIYMDMELKYGQMVVNIRDNGISIICMEMVHILHQLEIFIVDNSIWIINKVKEC